MLTPLQSSKHQIAGSERPVLLFVNITNTNCKMIVKVATTLCSDKQIKAQTVW